MAAELHVELVAADRQVWSGEATLVVARTTSGDIGVMPGHQPLLGVLESGPVTIRIFNAAGRLVRTLVDQPHTPGAYTVRWNGQDDAGRRLGSGVYFYEIQAAGFHDSRKLVLLK